MEVPGGATAVQVASSFQQEVSMSSKDEAVVTLPDYIELNRIIRLGLETQGSHHKQYCLYKAAKLLKLNIAEDIDKGIAP